MNLNPTLSSCLFNCERLGEARGKRVKRRKGSLFVQVVANTVTLQRAMVIGEEDREEELEEA